MDVRAIHRHSHNRINCVALPKRPSICLYPHVYSPWQHVLNFLWWWQSQYFRSWQKSNRKKDENADINWNHFSLMVRSILASQFLFCFALFMLFYIFYSILWLSLSWMYKALCVEMLWNNIPIVERKCAKAHFAYFFSIAITIPFYVK